MNKSSAITCMIAMTQDCSLSNYEYILYIIHKGKDINTEREAYEWQTDRNSWKNYPEPTCSLRDTTWTPKLSLSKNTITVTEWKYLPRLLPQKSINLVLLFYIWQVYPTFALTAEIYFRFLPKPFMRVENRQWLKSNIPIAYSTCMGDHHVRITAWFVQ